jgi:hypothetical protein
MGFDRNSENILSRPRFEILFNGGAARTLKYEVHGAKAKIAESLGYDPRSLTRAQYDEVSRIYKRSNI